MKAEASSVFSYELMRVLNVCSTYMVYVSCGKKQWPAHISLMVLENTVIGRTFFLLQ